MKVIAFKSGKDLIVEMSARELMNMAGFESAQAFNVAVGFRGAEYLTSMDLALKNQLFSAEIPVSEIYKEALETLGAYSELKSKLESVRNQITTLTGKMAYKKELEEPKKSK